MITDDEIKDGLFDSYGQLAKVSLGALVVIVAAWYLVSMIISLVEKA